MKAAKADRHVIEIAKAKVLVEGGKVRVLDGPRIKRCPVHILLSGAEEVTVANVRRAVEFMIRDEGMFTPNRKVKSSDELVPFGASEILMSALRHGVIECAVVACDCAGSVVTTKPEIVQGIGKRMTGLVETSPISAVIRRLQLTGAVVLDPISATIDQTEAASLAFKRGYERIAVTVTGSDADEIIALRKFERASGATIYLLAVHNSGIKRDAALLVARNADLVWGCASRNVIKIAGKSALMQIGIQIPVFSMTERGKELILSRVRDLNDQLLIGREKLPKIMRGLHPKPLR